MCRYTQSLGTHAWLECFIGVTVLLPDLHSLIVKWQHTVYSSFLQARDSRFVYVAA